MAKIKAVSVALSPSGNNMYVVDTKGQLWVKLFKNAGADNGAWQLIELPDEPKEPEFNVRRAL